MCRRWERLPTSDSLSSRRSVLAGSSRFEPSDGSLIIRKVEPEDAGKYLCLVSNGVGEERATVTLDVQGMNPHLMLEVLTEFQYRVIVTPINVNVNYERKR